MKKNLLLLLVSFLVSCIAAEIIFRLKGSYQSYQERASHVGYVSPFESRSKWGYGWDNTHKPFANIGGMQTEFNYTFIANNEGLKGDTLKTEKHGTRIMIFGDSFTESMGAPADSAYPQLLQQIIKATGNTTTQVINCGTAGADVFTEYQLLTGKMLKYKPDVVIVTFNSTDLYEYTIRGGFERFKPGNKVEYRTPPWFEPLYAKSYLVRVLVHDLLNYDYRFLPPARAAAMDSLAIKNTQAVVDSFRYTCHALNCKFGMVFHPMQDEYKQEIAYANTPIIDFCRQQQIPYTDNFDCMKQAGVNTNNIAAYYWPADGHYTAKGYLLLANCVYGFLQQQAWLPKEALPQSAPATN